MHRHDHLAKLWYFSHSKNDTCAEKTHIRNASFKRDSHNQYKDHGVYMNSDRRGTFWVTITNLVHDDQGIYCCVVHELHKQPESKQHARIALTVHGTTELKIVRGRSPCKTTPLGSALTHSHLIQCTAIDQSVRYLSN